MRVLPFDAVGGPPRTPPCQAAAAAAAAASAPAVTPTVAGGLLVLEMRGWCGFDARRV